MPDSPELLDEERREALLKRLCDTANRVVYFPVRHHSPSCALLIRDWIETHRPAAVLIEGPSDYNPFLDELFLGHQLPIAIYSYFRTEKTHSGVYYPFCEYSPEWLALTAGKDAGSILRFIDLPWSASEGDQRQTHRYADAELRRGRYVTALCNRLQVEDFDDLWDRMIESHADLTTDDYLRRAHEYCLSTRCWEGSISDSDRHRESFMAENIRKTMKDTDGRILVVTGGFHSSALVARVEEFPAPEIGLQDPPQTKASEIESKMIDHGVALTTYSYERLDGLHGYNAGMPSPGFYREVWQQRGGRAAQPFDHAPLLAKLVKALRQRKQTLSTADLIAVETTSQTLAAIRGRQHVWRNDLTDGVVSALIKDEVHYDGGSPFLDAVQEVLRGSQTGSLAKGVRLPPLVKAIQDDLAAYDLQPVRKGISIELDLLDPNNVEKSRLLHRLRALEIRGFRWTGGTDFLAREDLQRIWESWEIRWSPEFESSCIEAARYGTVLEHAVAAKLVEHAGTGEHTVVSACEWLIQAARCGTKTLSNNLVEVTGALIAREGQFSEIGEALGHLLYLFCFDEAFGTTRLDQLARLIDEAFARALWLFESLGQTAPTDTGVIAAAENLSETFRRVSDVLDVTDEEYAGVLNRIQADRGKSPSIRGAAAGMLWSIGGTTPEDILNTMRLFTSPDQLGDFLSGLFRLAREVAQRNPGLVRSIDERLLEFDGEGFQAALPSLRLAFTAFTPREKHYLLLTLFESLGLAKSEVPSLPSANTETAAEALGIEERIGELISNYGLEAVDGGI